MSHFVESLRPCLCSSLPWAYGFGNILTLFHFVVVNACFKNVISRAKNKVLSDSNKITLGN